MLKDLGEKSFLWVNGKSSPTPSSACVLLFLCFGKSFTCTLTYSRWINVFYPKIYMEVCCSDSIFFESNRAKQPLGQTGQGTRGKIALGDKCLACRDPLGIRKVIKAFSGSFLHWTTPNQKELPGKTFTLKSTFLFSSFCVLQFYSNTTSLAFNFSITVAPQLFFTKNLI